jgi:hypothetical protein
MKPTETQRQAPIVCDVTPLNPEQRARRETVAKQVSGAFAEIRELPDGYAFRLPSDSSILLAAAEFIALERLCCPFFTFTLDVQHDGGPIWFHLTGRDGVRQFLKDKILNRLESDSPRASTQNTDRMSPR